MSERPSDVPPKPPRREAPPRGTILGEPCRCFCHDTPGVVHVMACCGPPYEGGTLAGHPPEDEPDA